MSDSYNMTIPNIVSVTLLGVFPFAAYQSNLSSQAVIFHITAGLLILSVGFSLYVTSQVGAGDVKLLSTSALWFGLTPSLLEYIVLVSVFGAVLVLLIFLVRLLYSNNIVANSLLPNYVFRGKKVPYGIAIGLAGLLTYPNTEIMRFAISQMAGQ
ncbi:prepilin peptidase [Rhizobium sp. CFBP 8762]|nr:prepilin peptidase [Rhizobium sp. CFBP 8762]